MRKSQIQKQIQSYFTFKYTSRTEFCTVPPIPLRKTIQCVSEHQILYTFDSALYCYNQILGESEEILSSSNSRLSSISVVESSDNFIFVCDVRGKLLAITNDKQSFTSSIFSNPTYNISLNYNGKSFFCLFSFLGSTLLVNDSTENVPLLNTTLMTISSSIRHPFPVVCSRFHPTDNYFLSIGKSGMFQLVDNRQISQKCYKMSCSSADTISCALWDNLFAISSTNYQCELWDKRFIIEPIFISNSLLSPVCSCQFSTDGQFIALAESDDFVSIYRAKNLSENAVQLIDFIGETAGISFSPTSNSLFVGIGGDFVFSGIVEFEPTNFSERLLECCCFI